nr:receptor-like serine/threonine-protein kinase [Quercus suber]
MANVVVLAFYITVCFVVFVIPKIIISVLLYRRWKRKQMVCKDGFSGGKTVMFRFPMMQSLPSDAFLKKRLKLSNKDIIGSGGYGTVYRLTINESTAFAVKRLNKGTADRDRGFERKLEAMGDIKHRNIVTLHGYYTAPHYNLLIYELMPNGSPDTLLHEISSQAIYLLDQNMEARVSDFGLATLMEPDKTRVSTLLLELLDTLLLEEQPLKGMFYSFGVLLLELLTGKKPDDEVFIEGGSKFVSWVKAVVQEKEVYVLDGRLENCPEDEIDNVFSIALMCLKPEPSKRPTIAEAVKMLEKIRSDKVLTD